MANKVLQFKGTSSAARLRKDLEVYVDLDKDSSPNLSYMKCEPVMISDYIAYLHTETGNQATELSGYVCPEYQYIDDGNAQQVLSVFAVKLRAGYDDMYALYEKYTQPYRYRVSKLVNVKAVQNSLHQIFTWIPGERIINPEFGSNLRRYLYEGITDQNIEAIVAEIRHCVSKWEPRVVVDKVVNVQSTDDTENNTVRLDVVYHIIGLDDEQFRYTYTYHRSEA